MMKMCDLCGAKEDGLTDVYHCYRCEIDYCDNCAKIEKLTLRVNGVIRTLYLRDVCPKCYKTLFGGEVVEEDEEHRKMIEARDRMLMMDLGIEEGENDEI